MLDNSSPLSTETDARVGEWTRANDVELAHTPHSASRLNRIRARFTALRHCCLGGTDHESHEARVFLIRRCITWRNRHAQDRLRAVVKRAHVARHGTS